MCALLLRVLLHCFAGENAPKSRRRRQERFNGSAGGDRQDVFALLATLSAISQATGQELCAGCNAARQIYR